MVFDLDAETQMFRESVRRWVDNECPKAWCRGLERQEHRYPQELWNKLTDAGFQGIGIAEQYGGAGGDLVTQSVFMREFARNAAGLGWIWGITAFSRVNAIGMYGSEQQKEQFLPAMAKGQLRTAISITEPAGGTDLLSSMQTTARKVAGGWILQGEKIWTTTGDTADYLLLMARSNKDAEGWTTPEVPIEKNTSQVRAASTAASSWSRG